MLWLNHRTRGPVVIDLIFKRSILIKNRRQGKVEGQITDMRALIWKKIIIKLSETTKKYNLTRIQA